MATISITIADALMPEVRDAFASAYNYQTTINGQPNPETKAQFARRMVLEYIKDVVKGQRVRQAQAAINVPDVTDIT